MTEIIAPILLDAQQAADFLSISKREIYNLAFPHGPIPVHKLGPRLTRFAVTDLKAYVISCRYDTSEIKSGTASSSKRRSTGSESDLQKFFQQRGRKSRQTNSTRKNAPESTPRKLASNVHVLPSNKR